MSRSAADEEFEAKVKSLLWYHKMRLPCPDTGYVETQGEPYDVIWDNIRKTREFVAYDGMRVLDLGAFDGMWSFEAERLKAELVVSSDCNWEACERFMFAHRALNSKVVPLFNVPIHDLVNRLDVYLKGCNVNWKSYTQGQKPTKITGDPKFDIVQHLGLLYHLRDPMQSLLQCRSVMKDNASLLIETACAVDEGRPVMLFNASKNDNGWTIYEDPTTFWAPSLPCLIEMLRSSLFKVRLATANVLRFNASKIGRVALVATAVPLSEAEPRIVSELRNTYRTPGLQL